MNEGECAICYEKMEGESSSFKLTCGHYFHEKCIEELVKHTNKCPMCRVEFEYDNDDDDDDDDDALNITEQSYYLTRERLDYVIRQRGRLVRRDLESGMERGIEEVEIVMARADERVSEIDRTDIEQARIIMIELEHRIMGVIENIIDRAIERDLERVTVRDNNLRLLDMDNPLAQDIDLEMAIEGEEEDEDGERRHRLSDRARGFVREDLRRRQIRGEIERLGIRDGVARRISQFMIQRMARVTVERAIAQNT